MDNLGQNLTEAIMLDLHELPSSLCPSKNMNRTLPNLILFTTRFNNITCFCKYNYIYSYVLYNTSFP